MSRFPSRWRFTVDDYHRMAKAGILQEDDRAELIDGEVVRMAPIGNKHAFCVIALTDDGMTLRWESRGAVVLPGDFLGVDPVMLLLSASILN